MRLCQGCKELYRCSLNVSPFVLRLGRFQSGCSKGCQFCEFLLNCARLYEAEWSHLGQEDAARHVHYAIQHPPVRGMGEPHISLKWPFPGNGNVIETTPDRFIKISLELE